MPSLNFREFQLNPQPDDAGEKMPYVTSVERIGMRKGDEIGQEKGFEQGMQKGMLRGIPQAEAQILRRQLTRRFGPLPELAEAKLSQAPTDLLEVWTDRILDAESLDAVFREG